MQALMSQEFSQKVLKKVGSQRYERYIRKLKEVSKKEMKMMKKFKPPKPKPGDVDLRTKEEKGDVALH